ncbi:VanZ family protein [Amnibacterium sp.]|uniref:VanZ family protein n=1 Tax=Amnibacterium sp. TaxID=1872496 RepID=UPI0026212A43|nr:VanZ family protein [Amnibacterium sp.]MCU1472296.1 VanZ like family protein [Amnibacterium sp.]
MTRRPRLRLPELLVLGAAVAVLVLLLWPHHVDGAVTWIASAPALGAAGGSGGLVWWALEDLGNIALFAPLGFALAWWSRKPVFAILAGATVSLLCEALQHWIPSRHASLQDVAWNVLGTLAGVAIAFAVGRAVSTGRPTLEEELRALEQAQSPVEVDA